MQERLEKVRLADKFAAFDELWSPKTIAEIDGFALKAVKIDATTRV